MPVVLLPGSGLFSAGAAEEGAAQDRQASRRPANKQGGAKFIPETKNKERGASVTFRTFTGKLF